MVGCAGVVEVCVAGSTGGDSEVGGELEVIVLGDVRLGVGEGVVDLEALEVGSAGVAEGDLEVVGGAFAGSGVDVVLNEDGTAPSSVDS